MMTTNVREKEMRKLTTVAAAETTIVKAKIRFI